MSITNSEYMTIMREYDAMRLEEERQLRKRIEEVYEKLPVLQEIDNQIAHGSVEAVRHALNGNDTALKNLKQTNDFLILQKKDLLHRAGYSDDYLEMHYHCPLCEDTGYVNNQMCRCFRQAIINHFFIDQGRRELLEHENFSTFDCSYYSESSIDESSGKSYYELAVITLKKAHEFVREFDTVYRNLLISGTAGVGKTFLANCIAKALLDQGHTVMYLSAFRLFEIFKGYSFGSKEEAEASARKFDAILDCDLLIIDDLGTEMLNSYTNSQLFSCLEERHLRRHSTLITTNKSMEELKDRYSERIASRLTCNYSFIKLLGDDNRIKKLFRSTN